MNRFEIIGHLGDRPEIRTLNGGGQVANLRVAVNPTPYKDRDNGEWVNPPADWFYVSVYMPATVKWAEKKLTKGSQVRVQGSLRPRKFSDNHTGEDRWVMDLVVNNSRKGHEVVGLNLKPDEQAGDDE